jgi:hypothetical protein
MGGGCAGADAGMLGRTLMPMRMLGWSMRRGDLVRLDRDNSVRIEYATIAKTTGRNDRRRRRVIVGTRAGQKS